VGAKPSKKQRQKKHQQPTSSTNSTAARRKAPAKKSVCNTKLAESSAGTILLTKPAGLLYRRGAAEKGQGAEVRAGREQVTARNEPEDQLDH